MPDMRISEDTVLLIARLANEAEDMKDAANEALKSAWSDYRESLKSLGLKGKEISAEVGQLKAAIAEVRLTETDRDKRESKAEGIDGYVAILSAPRARARRGSNTTTQNISNSGDDSEKIDRAVTIPESQPQPTKAAGSDLAASPALRGQVADIPDIGTPISNDKPEANDFPSSDPQRSVAPIREDGGSDASGDGPDKSVETQVSAAPAPTDPLPGEVYWENTPRRPAKRHEYSAAFGTLGQDIHVITEDIAKAQSAAIVMMGDTILDGWARYNCARGMVGMNGQTTEYPAYQYDGADPLLDCIRWNLEGRILDVNQRQIIAKRLVALEPKRKADIIKAFGFAMEFAA